ncbi:hypothetical protein GCM10007939_18890 [Amylibacter marinus]|uniref:Uncharacterized protein n=1 Tax=Amylibacter marinus TaxID=1475483 RepID=A0ABQ5VX25_9RHOB|nr:DUF3726 domain-containing protein [Amylibacter marinus]GLQ35606.1 hypothetical protein GCM10007939_18890 [Amylibacter marinus]
MLSRSNIINVAQQAAFGAGYSWDLAQAAAKSTVYLIEHQRDGFGALLEVLNFADGKRQPLDISGDGPVCGITLGMHLSQLGKVPNDLPSKIVGEALLMAFIHDDKQVMIHKNWPAEIPDEIVRFAARINQASIPHTARAKR